MWAAPVLFSGVALLSAPAAAAAGGEAQAAALAGPAELAAWSDAASSAATVLDFRNEDDECSDEAGEGAAGSCAVSWLQRRGVALRRHAASQPDADTSATETLATGTPAADDSQEFQCPIDTGGTCVFFTCAESRGEAVCQHRRCKCKPGFCNDYGVCRSPAEIKVRLNSAQACEESTGGTCRSSGCYTFRLNSTCQDGQCVCQPGTCNVLGVCHPDVGTIQAKVAPVAQAYPSFPGPQGQVVTGMAFSGGGARAQIVAAGVLRALENLDLMSQVDAISSVSGGTWASAIYFFADMPMEKLLGPPTKPALLTLDELGNDPAALGKTATTKTAPISLRLWWEGVGSQLLWIYTMAEALLKPFGLDGVNSYMAPDAATVERIRRDNPQLKDAEFLVPAPGRPKVLVMSGSLLAPTGYKADADNVVSLQMSPDYSGSPFFPDDSTVSYPSQSGRKNEPLENRAVGGGLVESFAWGGGAPVSVEQATAAAQTGTTLAMSGPREPLSLAKAVGVSSAGPASALTQVGPHGAFDVANLNPRGNVWSVLKKGFSSIFGFQQAATYSLGDGGNIDNSGVLALLQRKVKRMVWLISSGAELPNMDDVCDHQALREDVPKAMDSQITSLFGYWKTDDLGEFLTNNQVFKQEDLPTVMCDLAKLHEAGKPSVTMRTLEVQENKWWGIAGGTSVDIVFFYNSLCQDFVDKLPGDTRTSLDRGVLGEFHRFPHYWPVFQNADCTSLTSHQVNLLAAHAEYMTLQTADLFRAAFKK